MTGNLLDGLPPEAKDVLVLQLTPRWTKADKERMRYMTSGWTQVHKQVFEDRIRPLMHNRPIRWS